MERKPEFYIAVYATALEAMTKRYIESHPEKKEYAMDYILKMATQDIMFQSGTYPEQVEDYASLMKDVVNTMIDQMYKKR